jgi:SAM-dependent methyltransferase
MAKVNLTEDVKQLMKLNARSRCGWERIERTAHLYDLAECRVLDIGIHGDVYPGGHAYMFEHASYETFDIDPRALPTHVGDLRDAPFEDETFDLIICNAVMEHILEGRDKAYQEIIRILKTGGSAIILAPALLDRESETAKMVTYRELDELSDSEVIKLENGDYYLEILK